MTEDPKEKKEIFLSEMADKLLAVYRDMSAIRLFDKEFLTGEKTDSFQETIDKLRVMAEEAGENAKAKLLEGIGIRFYGLQTIGVVDEPDKFADRASEVFAILEATLLALDGTIPKSRGAIMELIEKRKEEY